MLVPRAHFQLLTVFSIASAHPLSPINILCRFEDEKSVSGLYEEMWEENMSSERATLQLYLGEIIELISGGIMSSSWSSKRMFLYSLLYLGEHMKFDHLRFSPLHLNRKGILHSLWSYTILLMFSCRLLRQSVSYVTPLVRWYPHSTMFCSHLSWRKSLDAYGRYELVLLLLHNWNCFLLFTPSKAMCIDYISTHQMKTFIRILHVTVYYWGR